MPPMSRPWPTGVPVGTIHIRVGTTRQNTRSLNRSSPSNLLPLIHIRDTGSGPWHLDAMDDDHRRSGGGLSTGLAIFWFLSMLAGDSLCRDGRHAGRYMRRCPCRRRRCRQRIFFDGFSYPYFPGFRRYVPALAFPAFFALVGLVWQMLDVASGNQNPCPNEGIPNFHRTCLFISFHPLLRLHRLLLFLRMDQCHCVARVRRHSVADRETRRSLVKHQATASGRWMCGVFDPVCLPSV